MKLNLGCGQNKVPGYLNVDKFDACGPDQVVDLEIFPWPFADNSADEILMNHVLEHLGQETRIFLGIMRELYRVLKPGAQLRVRVPHPRSEAFLGDPTHVRPLSPTVLSLFSKKNNKHWKEKGFANSPPALYIDVDFEIVSTEIALTARWAKRLQSGEITREALGEAIESQFNVVDEFNIVLRKVAA